MSDQAIRTYVLQQLQTITPGIGVFFDYSRYPKNNDTKAFLDLFQDPGTKRIMGWEMSRVAVPSIVRVSNAGWKVTHRYRLEGYLSLQDSTASEKTFNAWIDAILQKLRDINIPNEQGIHLPSVPVIGQKAFGQVLCHYAQIEWPVSEIMTPTPGTEQDLLKIAFGASLDTADALLPWQPATNFSAGDIVVPSARNGHKYICSIAGLSGNAEPAWPVDAGGTTADGAITWMEDGAIMEARADISL